MNLPTFINKWIISNRFLYYTPIWWWYRLMSHEGYRFDDIQLGKSFWSSLNGGYEDMNYKWAFEQYWGKKSYPPEKIVLPKEDFYALVERLELPSEETMESIRRLMNRKTPFDND